MNVSNNLTFPDDIPVPDHGELKAFKQQIWHNSEICNWCYSRIRSVGPVVKRELSESGDRRLRDGPPLRLDVNAWHERTATGSQEHTRWDHNRRHGTCFCLECGSDGAAPSHTRSLDDLAACGQRIVEYLTQQTPYRADSQRFADVLDKLSSIDENAGYGTEKLAAATALATTHQRQIAQI